MEDNDPTMNRFKLLEIDDDPPRYLPEFPGNPVIGSFEGIPVIHVPVISEEEARAQKDAALVAKFLDTTEGRLNGTFYDPGTELMAEGKETARKLRLDWESRPVVQEAMAEIIGRVKAEERRDFDWPLSQLRVDHDGRMNGLGFDQWAWNGLMSKAPKDRGVVSGNVNSWIGNSTAERRFRTRNPSEQGRECYAVVSKRYQASDVDYIAGILAKQMPRDAHAEVTYEAATTKWSIDVTYSNPAMLSEATVGTAHRMGIRCEGADNGSRSIRIKHFAERIRCINCTIVTDEKLTLERRHLGNGLDVLIRRALSEGGKALESFSEVWKEANENRIHLAYDGTPNSAEETFKRLISHGYVKVAGTDDKELLGLLMTAWNLEPGDTAAHCNMAMTRAAQSLDRWDRNSVEEQAGELLYARVWERDLPGLSKEQREVY